MASMVSYGCIPVNNELVDAFINDMTCAPSEPERISLLRLEKDQNNSTSFSGSSHVYLPFIYHIA